MYRACLDDALVLEGEGHDDMRLPGVAQDDGRLAIDLGELGLERIREEAVRTHGEARHRATALAPGSGRVTALCTVGNVAHVKPVSHPFCNISAVEQLRLPGVN